MGGPANGEGGATDSTSTGESQPSVTLRSVTKRFGNVTAVDSIDLEIAQGEFFTLLGPSGCGKTTTLRMIAGFEEPDGGEILIEGADVAALPAHRRPTNTVFQSYALFPHLNVRDNVAYGLKRKGVDRDEIDRRVQGELERVGLWGESNRRPNQLSGGQQQRVAIARALALRPKVMLFDEVTSALDPELVGEVLNVIRRLAAEHKLTMLMVTHQMGFAREFSDRVCFFHGGRIAEAGPPDRLFGAPQNERTRQFLSAVLEAA